MKQHLQRTKQGSKSSHTYGRQSPLHGDHTAIPASRLPQSIPISIPLGPRPSEGPQKRSLEGLNSEIQKLVLTDASTERVCLLCVGTTYLELILACLPLPPSLVCQKMAKLTLKKAQICIY